MKKIKILIFLCLLFSFISCDKFIMNNELYLSIEDVVPVVPVIPVDYVILQSSGLMVQKKDLSTGCTWSIAKELCDNSSVGEFPDWRIPTLAELTILYENRNMIGGFSNTWYWSSTEKSASSYYVLNFNNNQTSSYETTQSFHIRAVRTLP
jgi:hypothetical protein